MTKQVVSDVLILHACQVPSAFFERAQEQKTLTILLTNDVSCQMLAETLCVGQQLGTQ